MVKLAIVVEACTMHYGALLHYLANQDQPTGASGRLYVYRFRCYNPICTIQIRNLLKRTHGQTDKGNPDDGRMTVTLLAACGLLRRGRYCTVLVLYRYCTCAACVTEVSLLLAFTITMTSNLFPGVGTSAQSAQSAMPQY